MIVDGLWFAQPTCGPTRRAARELVVTVEIYDGRWAYTRSDAPGAWFSGGAMSFVPRTASPGAALDAAVQNLSETAYGHRRELRRTVGHTFAQTVLAPPCETCGGRGVLDCEGEPGDRWSTDCPDCRDETDEEGS